VLAFIDDDAFAEPEWLERLLPAYRDPTVGAVGGRQIRGQPGEITEGADDIGRLREDGTLSGNFTADPGRWVEVDHLLGANMSFRRSVLDQIGGIRDGYGGTCVREETDLCLRVAQAGYRLVYTPDAVVEHVAAPYAKGRRFDLRYAYWAQKNHLIVLIRNFGPVAPIVRTYLATSLGQAARAFRQRFAGDGDHDGGLRGAAAGVARLAVVLGATASGTATGWVLLRRDRRER
jgi:GT2 family glycosyltransferase